MQNAADGESLRKAGLYVIYCKIIRYVIHGTGATLPAIQCGVSQFPGPMKTKSANLLSLGILASFLACTAPIARGAGARQAGPTVAGIREASFGDRTGVTAEIAARVDDDERGLRRLKTHAATDEAGASGPTAMSDVAARRRLLRSDLKAIPSIIEDGWSNARADLAADYGAYLEAVARARALAAAAPVEASTMLDAGTTIDSVHSADFESRVQAAAAVRAKLGASARAVAALESMSDSLQGDSKAAFRVAIADMRDRAKRLEASVSDAEKAPVEDWSTARAQLAADYGSYAEAVARAEFAASGSRS